MATSGLTHPLADTWPLVEQIIGRQLRASEQAIDVLGLDAALKQAKAALERAIRAEQHRVSILAVQAGFPLRLEVTPRMARILTGLYRLGRREARAELDRLGIVVPRRMFALDPLGYPEKVRRHLQIVAQLLRGLEVKLGEAKVEAELAGLAQDAILGALLTQPGARGIAAEVVSGALDSGLASTFEEADAAGVVGGWEYTAVLDGGTCDPCDALDGEVFESWEAIQEVLPDGGPNPDCDGGGRCRCRAVPLAA